MKIYDLIPNDSHKSFYGKAKVYEQQRESLKSLARDFIKGVCNHE